MTQASLSVSSLASLIVARSQFVLPHRALLVGISGIDGAGKGHITEQLTAHLRAAAVHAVAVNVDGWLNLPEVRFDENQPAAHFYTHALRLDQLFADLVLPLRAARRIDLVAAFAEETATQFRPHRYHFDAVDVILLEGIYLFKRAYRPHFDLAVWIECSFATALSRAVARAQEGLPPDATIQAYQTIYFPAQRIHFDLDTPREAADFVLVNDGAAQNTPAGAG